MTDIAAEAVDRYANLRSLVEAHERLAAAARMELAALAGEQRPPAALLRAKTVARHMLAFRHRVRAAHVPTLGEAFLQDPAMELMLEAFARQVEGKPLSLTGLHNHTESSQTTALRWGARLCEAGLASRSADPFDHRREWFALEASLFDELALLLSQLSPSTSDA